MNFPTCLHVANFQSLYNFKRQNIDEEISCFSSGFEFISKKYIQSLFLWLKKSDRSDFVFLRSNRKVASEKKCDIIGTLFNFNEVFFGLSVCHLLGTVHWTMEYFFKDSNFCIRLSQWTAMKNFPGSLTLKLLLSHQIPRRTKRKAYIKSYLRQSGRQGSLWFDQVVVAKTVNGVNSSF